MNAVTPIRSAPPASRRLPDVSLALKLATLEAKARSAALKIRYGVDPHSSAGRPIAIQRAAEWLANGGQKLLDEIQSLKHQLDVPGWWDDNGDISRRAVGILLAELLGSFPTSNIPNPATFSKVLLDDVMERQPEYRDLSLTCRELRQTKPFTPSISEVLAVLDAHCEANGAALDATECITSYRNEIEEGARHAGA